MTSRNLYRIAPYLACLAACAAANLFYFPPTTTFSDEQRFLASAALFAASGQFWVGADRAWEMPGPALFFAPAVWLFGPQAAIVPIRFAQAAALVIQCGLVAIIARQVFRNATAAFVASCVVAIYPFFVYYQGLLLSETLFNTLLLTSVAALFWWRDRGFRLDLSLVAACLCFAAATMTKATLTILPPLLLAAAAWLAGVTMRRVITILVVASCLYASFMSPWWIRNALLFNAFVPFTTSSAQNLYLGNNPNNPDADINVRKNVEPDVIARIRALPDELARQRAFSKAALDYITDEPARFVTVAAKKFIRFWNIFPNAAEFQSGAYSIISAASFTPILVLALICVARRREQWRQLAPFYLIIGYFTFVHVVTIASLRYRLPLEPLLIVLASEPLAACVAYLSPKQVSSS